MAIGQPKFPLDDITGVLGQIDRSVGKDGGLALCMGKSPNSTILGVKTKRTTTRSPAQIERAAIYCACDKAWEALSFWKKLYTCTYRRKVQGKSSKRFSNYLCWMSICLADAWDENLFRMNSYVTRYVIQNTTGTPWTDHKVTLINIPTKTGSGIDLTVQQTDYKRLPQNIIHHKVNSKGSVIVCLPEMPPGKTIYIDVYSYGDYSTVQNCSAVSESELNDSILANSNTVPYAFSGAYNVDVSFTPDHDGPLYMMYCAFYCGSGTNINLTTNTPKNEYIGNTGKNFYGIPLYIWGFGSLKAGQPYSITGCISDPGSEACTCGDPAGYICHDWNYYGALPYNKKVYSPGLENACHPDWYANFRMIQLQAGAFNEISPESTIKIGPT